MPDITVTKEQVEELAAKLDRLGEELDDEERALLLAIFALAGEAVGRRSDEDVEGFLFGPSTEVGARLQVSGLQSPPTSALSDGFKSAFTRGPVGGVGGGQGIIAILLG
jgi:hypothetical protein